jgi:hypothetical protein
MLAARRRYVVRPGDVRCVTALTQRCQRAHDVAAAVAEAGDVLFDPLSANEPNMARQRLTAIAAPVPVAAASAAAVGPPTPTPDLPRLDPPIGVPRVYGAVIDDNASMTRALSDIFNIDAYARVGGRDPMWLVSTSSSPGHRWGAAASAA